VSPMHPTKILHPTDYTETSRAALHEALDLAEEHGAALVLLHVVETLGPEKLTYGELSHVRLDDYRQRLGAELGRVPPPDTHVHTEYVLSEEDVVTAILRTAAERGCDLIVLGTHGTSGWRRWFTRSVAEEVVRRASCPVLVVKEAKRSERLPERAVT